MLEVYYYDDDHGFEIVDQHNSSFSAFILFEEFVVFYGCQTGEVTDPIRFQTVEKLLHTFSKIKISWLLLAEIRLDSDLYEAVKHIPHYHMDITIYHNYCYLAVAKINPEVGDTVLLIMGYPASALIFEFKFTSDGYEIMETREVNDNIQDVKTKIFGSSNPKEIIIANAFPTHFEKKLFDVLKGRKIIKIDKHNFGCSQEFMSEMEKWMVDKSYVKCFIRANCNQKFLIFKKNDANETPLISVKTYETLPLTKFCIVSKIDLQFLTITDPKCASIIEKIPFQNNGHRFKVNFSVDTNNNPHWKVEPIILPKLKELPQKLNESLKTKHPVIGIFDNTSFICISKKKNKKNGYKFMKSWNGLFGNELVISFVDEKPKIGLPAMKDLQSKSESVIYDLIKIMAMPEDNIKMINSWGFKIKKGIDHPILIQFQSSNGKLENTTPESSFAYLLKKHLQTIKSEIGEKPKQVTFCIFNKFTNEETERIQKKIMEAGKMLNIACYFFDVS